MKRALKKRCLPDGVRVVLSQNRADRLELKPRSEESFEEALSVAVDNVVMHQCPCGASSEQRCPL